MRHRKGRVLRRKITVRTKGGDVMVTRYDKILNAQSPAGTRAKRKKS